MLIIIFGYSGKDYVDDFTRNLTFGIMTAIGALGVLVLVFIKEVKDAEHFTTKEAIKKARVTFPNLSRITISPVYL